MLGDTAAAVGPPSLFEGVSVRQAKLVSLTDLRVVRL